MFHRMSQVQLILLWTTASECTLFFLLSLFFFFHLSLHCSMYHLFRQCRCHLFFFFFYFLVFNSFLCFVPWTFSPRVFERNCSIAARPVFFFAEQIEACDAGYVGKMVICFSPDVCKKLHAAHIP